MNLRDWLETDLEDMFVFLSYPNVTIPEGASPCKTLEECKRVLDYLIEKKNNYAIEWKENGIIIGSIAIDTIAVEHKIDDNMYQRSELDYLIYNTPLEYADLILSGDPEAYLKTATEYKPLD